MPRIITAVIAVVLCWPAAARGQSLQVRLQSPVPETREAARQEFLKADDATKRAAVHALLEGATPSSRFDTLFTAIGSPAADQYLIETVTNEDSFFAARRAHLLMQEADARVLQPKLADQNPYVRWAAAMTLVWNGVVPKLPEQIVPVIVEALKEGSPAIRREALITLGSLSDYKHYRDVCAPVVDPVDATLVTAMRDQDFEISHAATGALSRCPSLPVSIAAREIGDPHGARLPMIWNLERRGAEAKAASAELIAALQDERGEVREAVAKTLRAAGIAPELYVPQILDEFTSGRDESARMNAAERLSAVAPAAAAWTPQISKIFDEERSPNVRGQLHVALNAIGTPEATRAAASGEWKQWVLAPAFVASMTVASVLAVWSGWGVLLGFLLPATSLIWYVTGDDGVILPAIAFAPFLSLAGLITCKRFGDKSDSRLKEWVGIFGMLFSVIALACSGGIFLLLFLLYMFW